MNFKIFALKLVKLIKLKINTMIKSVPFFSLKEKRGFLKKALFFLFYSKLRNAASVSYFVRLFDIVSVSKEFRGIAL